MIQRILKPSEKPVIIADFRETKSITNLLKKMGTKVNALPLEVGDYIISDRVAIERKNSEDFINSIIDGRLFEQAKELKDNFSKPIVIVEGNYFRESMNENAVKAALASLILDYEIPIMMTQDEGETAKLIFWLAKKEQVSNEKDIGIKGRKKPKDIKKLQEHIISSLPGISTVLSRRILSKFGSIKKFVKADEGEMSKVNGLGKASIKRLRDVLEKEYE